MIRYGYLSAAALVGGGGVGFKFPLASGCVFVVVDVVIVNVVIVAYVVLQKSVLRYLTTNIHSFIFVHLVLPLQFYT